MKNPLMRAVIESAAFAELNDDDVIDADAAVGHLEQLASILQDLDPAAKSEFVEYVRSTADLEEAAGVDEARVQFLRTLPETLGLV
jgi:hypothetical protein